MDRRYVGDFHQIIKSAEASVDSRCMFFDRSGRRCKEAAIQSHSLQKRGPLEAISENGHVVKAGPTLRARPVEQREVFETIGVKKASVFRGFCSKHDSELFEPIETTSFEYEPRIAVIFAIRAMAMELERKYRMVAIQDATLRHLEDSVLRGQPEIPRWIRKGAIKAIHENMHKLKSYFKWLYRQPPSNFLYSFYEFDRDLPFAVSGAFEPEWDLQGRALYKGNPTRLSWNSVNMFAGNISNRSIAVLSGMQKYRDHRMDWFLHSVDCVEERMGETLFSLAAIHSENLYMNPSWFDSLPEAERLNIEEMVFSGLLEGIRDPSVFSIRATLPISSVVNKKISWV